MDHTSVPGAGAPAEPPSSPPGASFFDSIRRSGLFRTQERWIGGVAGGIGYRLGIDPLIVRGVLVVLTFFGGLGLLLYGLGWAFLPEQIDGRIHAQEMLRGHLDPGLAGAAVMVIIGLARPGLWWQSWWWGEPWPLFGLFVGLSVTFLVVWLVLRDRDRYGPGSAPTAGAGPADPGTDTAPSTADDPDSRAAPGEGTSSSAPAQESPSGPATPTPQWAAAPATSTEPADTGAAGPPPSGTRRHQPAAPPPPAASHLPYSPGPGRVLTLTVTGLALLGLAAALFTSRALGMWTDATLWLLGAGVVLAVVGLGIFISGARGRRGGGLTGLSVLAMLLVVPVTLTLGIAPQVREALSLSPTNIGDAHWAPTTAADLTRGYTHTAGDLEVDLGALPPDADLSDLSEPVPITLAAGRIVVRVPADLDIDLRVEGTGAVRVDHPAVWYSNGSVVRSETSRALLRQEITMRSAPEAGRSDLQLNVAIGAGQVRLIDAPPIGIRSTTTDATTQET